MYVNNDEFNHFEEKFAKVYILGKKVGFATGTIIPDTDTTWPKSSGSTTLPTIMRYGIASGTNLIGG
jgi:hypothetical protein